MVDAVTFIKVKTLTRKHLDQMWQEKDNSIAAMQEYEFVGWCEPGWVLLMRKNQAQNVVKMTLSTFADGHRAHLHLENIWTRTAYITEIQKTLQQIYLG